MKDPGYQGNCSECPIGEQLSEHYLSHGISGLYDEFSRGLYSTCESCVPDIMEREEAMRDAFLMTQKIEHKSGEGNALAFLRGFLEYAGTSKELAEQIVGEYKRLRGIEPFR